MDHGCYRARNWPPKQLYVAHLALHVRTCVCMCSNWAPCCTGTFCGVFRRQALDRGAALLKAECMVTGHNADDMAETVLMNSTLAPVCCLSAWIKRNASCRVAW